MAPIISVIMPVYNGEKYIKEAIESILNQTFKDFEFIIIDDGSTDKSSIIIHSYQDTRIRYLLNPIKKGVTFSLNLGLSLAQGELIARMDADDISSPNRFEEQVRFLSTNPEIQVLGTGVRLIDQSGNIGQEVIFPNDHISLLWHLCFFENPIIHPSVIMRKYQVDKVGGYNSNLETSQDYELWCRMSKFGRLANLPGVYLYLRKHTSSISSKKWRLQQKTGMEISRQLLSVYLNENLTKDQVEGPCRVVWTPKESDSNDYFQLAKLKYKLGTIFLSNRNFSNKEKNILAKVILIEIIKLSFHFNEAENQKKSKSWIKSLTRFVNKTEEPDSNKKEKNEDRLIKLKCPKHNLPLFSNEDYYFCNQGCLYPIINHIPRFVSKNNYARMFGAQWKKYQKIQLDSYIGKTISRDRLERLVGGNLSIVADKLVLEAGCGAGRFTEVLLHAGAKVIATDLSDAVEANFDNFHNYINYEVFEADLNELPLMPQQFDIVIGIGVIQHTPDPEESIKSLSDFVKPGGMLVIDHYTYNYPFTLSRRIIRSILLKTSPVFSIWFCQALVSFLWPIHKFLWKNKKAFFIRRFFYKLISWSPIVDYTNTYPQLGPELLYNWALLDTHDNLTDYYKHFRSIEEIENALTNAGMIKIFASYNGNGVEARAFKPE